MSLNGMRSTVPGSGRTTLQPHQLVQVDTGPAARVAAAGGLGQATGGLDVVDHHVAGVAAALITPAAASAANWWYDAVPAHYTFYDFSTHSLQSVYAYAWGYG